MHVAMRSLVGNGRGGCEEKWILNTMISKNRIGSGCEQGERRKPVMMAMKHGRRSRRDDGQKRVVCDVRQILDGRMVKLPGTRGVGDGGVAMMRPGVWRDGDGGNNNNGRVVVVASRGRAAAHCCGVGHGANGYTIPTGRSRRSSKCEYNGRSSSSGRSRARGGGLGAKRTGYCSPVTVHAVHHHQASYPNQEHNHQMPKQRQQPKLNQQQPRLNQQQPRLNQQHERMRIAVDVDEVLGRFVHSLNAFCLERYGSLYHVNDYHVYDFAKVWNCSQDESNKRVHEFFTSRHFREGIEVIPGSYESLLRLQQEFELVVVTSRQHVIEQHTVEWLEEHFPGIFDAVHFGNHFALEGTSRKKSEICREIGAHVLVDDNPWYAMECACAGIQVLLYDWNEAYPWSKTDGGHGPVHENITRVRDWHEVEHVLARGAFLHQNQGTKCVSSHVLPHMSSPTSSSVS